MHLEQVMSLQYESMLKIMIPKNWAEKPPPHPSGQTGKTFQPGSIHFMQFPATLVQLAEKPKLSVIHFEQSWSP